jgi:hypothetical protein
MPSHWRGAHDPFDVVAYCVRQASKAEDLDVGDVAFQPLGAAERSLRAPA